MELLAPVGTKESLITAVRAGADAVYIGVPGFNARMAAPNISFYDLKVFIDYAHEKGVKVFLAMNTLVKYAEIHETIKIINQIDQLHPDAVIIQDFGLADIISKYFKNIELHASTQMAVHNRMGVEVLAEAGFKRAIMARELSYSELKIIAKSSPIPLEVFCHGALCFSISGQCLFSSFIGGLSGNRGKCTQPCRRLWHQGKRRGYLFSPRDMELAEHVGKLKKIGIAALKIEGRMRSSEYVYRVVKAYRLLIDADDASFAGALAAAREILAGDFARKKTTCLFSGRAENIFQPEQSHCLGNLLGKIKNVKAGQITLELFDNIMEIVSGDRLRVSNPAEDYTKAFKVKEFVKEGNKYTVTLENAKYFKSGNPVYRTADIVADQKNIAQDLNNMYENHYLKFKRKNRKIYPVSQAYTAIISNKWKKEINIVDKAGVSDTLWLRFNDIKWLDVLNKPNNKMRLVFALNLENIYKCDEIISRAGNEITMELPPFIGNREIKTFRQQIEKMLSGGVKNWVLNNISQLKFFKDEQCVLTAGHFLYAWNAYAAAFLWDRGITSFTVSWEDDFLNMKAMSGPGLGRHMIVYTYGYPPVVRSKIITQDYLGKVLIKANDKSKGNIAEKEETGFFPVPESKLSLLMPFSPVCIFSSRSKLKKLGIRNFGIDLSFIKTDKQLLNALLSGYTEQENILNSVKFNFKRSIK
ncbi:MAG: peptidase U32 family protein [bacterium]